VIAHPLVQCCSKLSANASAHPLDVVKIKSTLKTLGHYDVPEWGVSPYPDAALFDAIKAFQKSQGLKVDGVIDPDGPTEGTLARMLTPHRAQGVLHETAQALQKMGRGRDELLAHITPEEAQLLHTITDGATINPHTGLLEFGIYGGFGRDAVSGHNGREGSGDGHGSFDPSADHKANQGGASQSGMGGAKEGSGDQAGSSGIGDQSEGLVGSSQKGDLSQVTGQGVKGEATSRSRRASAKENTLPGDTLGGGGLGDEEDEDALDWDSNLLGDYDSIEGVSTQPTTTTPTQTTTPQGTANKKTSKFQGVNTGQQYNAHIKDWVAGKLKEEQDRKVWNPNPYWSPGLNPDYTTPIDKKPQNLPSLKQKPSYETLFSGDRNPSLVAFGAIMDRYINDPDFRDWIDTNRDAFVNTMTGFSPTDFFGNGPGSGPASRRRR